MDAAREVNSNIMEEDKGGSAQRERTQSRYPTRLIKIVRRWDGPHHLEDGLIASIKERIQRGDSVHAIDHKGRTVLHYLISSRFNRAAAYIVEHAGADPFLGDYEKANAFSLLCMGACGECGVGSLALLEWLLDHIRNKGTIEQNDKLQGVLDRTMSDSEEGEGPKMPSLLLAGIAHTDTDRGGIGIVDTALRYGADASRVWGRIESTPLHMAVERDSCAVALLLLRHGARIDHVRRDGATPLMISMLRKESDMMMLLLQHGADPFVCFASQTPTAYKDNPFWRGRTIADMAYMENRGISVADTLRTWNEWKTSSLPVSPPSFPPPQVGDVENLPPLVPAAPLGRLVAYDVAVEPLFSIVRGWEGSPHMQDSLIHKIERFLAVHPDAPLDCVDADGMLPCLHHLVNRRMNRAARYLIERGGADPLSMNGVGETVLSMLIKGSNDTIGVGAVALLDWILAYTRRLSTEHANVLDTLLNERALLDNHDSMSLMQLAITRKWSTDTVVHILLKNGARADGHASNDHLPLHCCVAAVKHACALMLLEHGARIDAATTGNGATSLALAVLAGSTDMVTLLLRHGADPKRRMGDVTGAGMDRSWSGKSVYELAAIRGGAMLGETLRSWGRMGMSASCP